MAANSRPNILFIMADQLRYDYIGAAGADFVRTPNLDRLAGQGVHFTHCAVNSPVCAPSRIALASGLQPWRLGALSNRSFLPRSTTTYYQRLRDHDYRVGCVGKLDLAKPDNYNGRHGDRPRAFGFGFTHPEECEGKMHAGHSAEPIGPYTHFLAERGLLEAFHRDYTRRAEIGWVEACEDSVLPADAFEDGYIGQRAVEWIDRVPDDFPWHYFVSFVGPHDPFDPPTEYAERYRNAAMPEPIQGSLDGKPARIEGRQWGMSPDEIRVARRQYCAAIELIDDYVGRILDALAARGMLENTFIIFSSDHGEMLGDHGLFTKHTAYEPAWRVPLIVAGPGVSRGINSDALIELIDLNPTICELAGLPAQDGIDAHSFAPLLRGEATTHRADLMTSEEGYHALRTERYKYIETIHDRAELYDLADDPEERHNLIEEAPAIAAELSGRLRARYVEGKWMRG